MKILRNFIQNAHGGKQKKVFVSYLYDIGCDEIAYANCVVSVDRRIKDYYDIVYLSKQVKALSTAEDVVILYYKEMGRHR